MACLSHASREWLTTQLAACWRSSQPFQMPAGQVGPTRLCHAYTRDLHMLAAVQF